MQNIQNITKYLFAFRLEIVRPASRIAVKIKRSKRQKSSHLLRSSAGCHARLEAISSFVLSALFVHRSLLRVIRLLLFQRVFSWKLDTSCTIRSGDVASIVALQSAVETFESLHLFCNFLRFPRIVKVKADKFSRFRQRRKEKRSGRLTFFGRAYNRWRIENRHFVETEEKPFDEVKLAANQLVYVSLRLVYETQWQGADAVLKQRVRLKIRSIIRL